MTDDLKSVKVVLTPHYYEMSSDEVLTSVHSSKVQGLSSQEVLLRQQKYGANVLPQGRKVTFLEKLWSEINSVLIYVLMVGAAVSFAFDHLADAIVILGVIVVNVSVSLYMESKAESTSEKLMAMMSPSATVLRNGERLSVPSTELTIGDIVILQPGDIVPADGRVVTSTDLQVLEAALTGESHAILKVSTTIVHAEGDEKKEVPIAERTNMVYSGTQVLKGTGSFVVTFIGKDSEIGKISDMLSNVQHQKTPLMIQLDVFARYLAIAIISLALIALGVAFARGYEVDESFSFSIGIAVAAIPEGLPSVVTITFAIGVRYMAMQRAIIKTLPAVETLGSVSVICSDKTGTLTQNLMTVTSFAFDGGVFDYTDSGVVEMGTSEKSLTGLEGIYRMIPGIFCNDSTIKLISSPDNTLGYDVQGDPTEACIFSVVAKVAGQIASKAGVDADIKTLLGSNGDSLANLTASSAGATVINTLLRSYPRLSEVPFDSSTKYMATLHEISTAECARWFGDGAVAGFSTSSVRIIFVKGAPERVLSMTSAVGATWQAKGESLASRGMRVLGLAYRVLPPIGHPHATPSSAVDALAEEDIFTGRQDFTMWSLVGIIDPPRPEAIVAVHHAQEAGIAVKMITGDHPVTALAIAKQLGIHRNPMLFGEQVPRSVRARTISRARSRSRAGTIDDFCAITGTELDIALNTSETAFDELVISNHVFARTTPEHKLKIVQSLQRQRVICSMTGDGVNDAPALKAANIGVAMGITGTGVAKEAAKMVVTDDNFATIVEAVRIGRCTYHNLVKVLAFVLPTNGGQAFSIIMALVIGLEVPITALQILWVNMVTSITLGLVLAFEKPHPDIMHTPPRRSNKPVFGKFLAWRLFFVTVVLVFAVLGNFHWEKISNPNFSYRQLRTLAVNTLSVCQVAYLFSCRNLRTLAGPYRTFVEDSREIWMGILCVAGFQALFTYCEPFQEIFQTEGLDGWAWGRCFVFGAATYLVIEMEKIFSFYTMRSRRLFWAWICRSRNSRHAAGHKPKSTEYNDIEMASAIQVSGYASHAAEENKAYNVEDLESLEDELIDDGYFSSKEISDRTLSIPFEEL